MAKIVLIKSVSKIAQKSSIIIGALHLAICGHMSHDSPFSTPKWKNVNDVGNNAVHVQTNTRARRRIFMHFFITDPI